MTRGRLILGSVVAVVAVVLGIVAYPEAAAPHGANDTAALPLKSKVSTSPRRNYVDSCITTFAPPPNEPAQTWIDTANNTWDSQTKPHVEGAVSWPTASYSVTLSGADRIVRSNDLPVDHTTGVFPIARTDPAYTYDQNPNTIKAQTIDWTLPANPVAAARPYCTSGGPIGILSDGVVLFNALDGNGRDAPAYEVLDSCDGHPDISGTYHHHTVPSCILDQATGRSTLVGYAIDGYGIYVERNAKGALLTDANLDACHGRTSTVLWNGRETTIYHYDATAAFPYTVGCYHGTPVGEPGG
ncbi:MAG: YHYH protein [Acidimicrobiales bacterium]